MRDVRRVDETDPNYETKCADLESEGFKLVSESPNGRRVYLRTEKAQKKRIRRKPKQVAEEVAPEENEDGINSN